VLRGVALSTADGWRGRLNRSRGHLRMLWDSAAHNSTLFTEPGIPEAFQFKVTGMLSALEAHKSAQPLRASDAPIVPPHVVVVTRRREQMAIMYAPLSVRNVQKLVQESTSCGCDNELMHEDDDEYPYSDDSNDYMFGMPYFGRRQRQRRVVEAPADVTAPVGLQLLDRPTMRDWEALNIPGLVPTLRDYQKKVSAVSRVACRVSRVVSCAGRLALLLLLLLLFLLSLELCGGESGVRGAGVVAVAVGHVDDRPREARVGSHRRPVAGDPAGRREAVLHVCVRYVHRVVVVAGARPCAAFRLSPALCVWVSGDVTTTRPSITRGGFLCDEMGLGKTVELIALILANKRKKSHCDKNLVFPVASSNDEVLATLTKKNEKAAAAAAAGAGTGAGDADAAAPGTPGAAAGGGAAAAPTPVEAFSAFITDYMAGLNGGEPPGKKKRKRKTAAELAVVGATLCVPACIRCCSCAIRRLRV
jgi:hypothetical protein